MGAIRKRGRRNVDLHYRSRVCWIGTGHLLWKRQPYHTSKCCRRGKSVALNRGCVLIYPAKQIRLRFLKCSTADRYNCFHLRMYFVSKVAMYNSLSTLWFIIKMSVFLNKKKISPSRITTVRTLPFLLSNILR